MKGRGWEWGMSSFFKGRVGRSKDLMVFCRQFSTLMSAGVTVLAAVKILTGQNAGRPLAAPLRGVLQGLEGGRSLSHSFGREGRAFPPLFISMVEAGESGGRLEEVLQRLADYYEKDHDLRERLKSALIYPLLILAAAGSAMIFIIVRVLPVYADIFLYFGAELPLLTRLLLDLGRGVELWWHLVLPALILLVLLGRKGMGSGAGRYLLDRLLVRAPLYGELYRKVVVARFARVMGILLSSGLNLMTSLELTENSLGNSLYAAFLREARLSINGGHSLSGTLGGARLFPPMAVKMMGVGEQTGNLEDMFHKIADFTEGEIKYAVDRFSSLIEPVLILVLAIFVGVMAMSVFLPMFDMFELVR